MIDKILNVDGPLMGLLNKTGQLIVLSVLWLLCCIPVPFIPAATTALYYAVCKSVRFEQGSATKEFWRSFSENRLRGLKAGFVPALLTVLLTLNLRVLHAGQGSDLLRCGTAVLLAVLVAAQVYICPVLSRFTLKTADVWKLSFVMALRFWPLTVLILAGAALGAAAQFFLLPIPTLAILPGSLCLAATWPVEKALRHYMPPKEENDNSWYYG